MAAGDVSDGEGHGEDCESEGERDADEGYTEVWCSGCRRAGGLKGGGEDSASAATEDKPEGPEEFS